MGVSFLTKEVKNQNGDTSDSASQLHGHDHFVGSDSCKDHWAKQHDPQVLVPAGPAFDGAPQQT